VWLCLYNTLYWWWGCSVYSPNLTYSTHILVVESSPIVVVVVVVVAFVQYIVLVVGFQFAV
jgi:hypothetical protein